MSLRRLTTLLLISLATLLPALPAAAAPPDIPGYRFYAFLTVDVQAEEPLQVYVVDGELRIVSRRQGIRRAQAIAAKVRQPGMSVVDAFIAEKRAEAAQE